MEEPILEVRNLTKHYTDSRAGINDIHFSLRRGEIAAIIGESGSGKSTLLKSIFGTLKVDQGATFCNGTRVKGPDEVLIPGHPSMRMVSQDFNLNIYAKVYDNIASMISNINIATKHEKTMQVLEQLHISKLKDKKITQLSGGEQQRVAIARALVNSVDVLLLDEPFSQVDTLLKSQLRTDLKHLALENGLAIVLVSHDPVDGISLADHLLILKEGMVLQQGTPSQVYNQPKYAHVAKLLGSANILNSEQANKIGLKVSGEVAIYPEWIEFDSSLNAQLFSVTQIMFKGAFQDVRVTLNGVELIATIPTKCRCEVGSQVNMVIAQFAEMAK